MGLVAFGIGLGFGVAAYRHLPAIAGQTVGVVVIVWCVGLMTAYFAGRRVGSHQWQFQMQEQSQEQEQTQQQAVVVNVLDRKQVVEVAGGVPALAGDPATPGLPGPFLQVDEGQVQVVPVLGDGVAVPEVGCDSVLGGPAGLGAVTVGDRNPALLHGRLGSIPQECNGDDS
jgi:hypothetical protein